MGQFQCYDQYMLNSLSKAADEAGHPEWGYGGPHDAGMQSAQLRPLYLLLVLLCSVLYLVLQVSQHGW